MKSLQQTTTFLTHPDTKKTLVDFYSKEITSAELVKRLVNSVFRHINDLQELEGLIVYITGYDYTSDETFEPNSSGSFIRGLYDSDTDYLTTSQIEKIEAALEDILDEL